MPKNLKTIRRANAKKRQNERAALRAELRRELTREKEIQRLTRTLARAVRDTYDRLGVLINVLSTETGMETVTPAEYAQLRTDNDALRHELAAARQDIVTLEARNDDLVANAMQAGRGDPTAPNRLELADTV